MKKADPNPLYRIGICQGCKAWDVRLVRVSQDRYRCETCARDGDQRPDAGQYALEQATAELAELAPGGVVPWCIKCDLAMPCDCAHPHMELRGDVRDHNFLSSGMSESTQTKVDACHTRAVQASPMGESSDPDTRGSTYVELTALEIRALAELVMRELEDNPKTPAGCDPLEGALGKLQSTEAWRRG